MRLFDGAEVPTPADRRESLAIYATSSPRPGPHVAQWRMSPWGADQWIEYLLAMHRDACGSVMTRLRAAKSTANLKGIPAFWRPALDEMASDPTLADPCLALIRVLEQSVPPGAFAPLQRIALAEVLHLEPNQVGVDPRDVAVLLRDAGPEDGPALPGGGPAPPEIDPALGPILQLLWFCSAGASEPRFPLSLLMNSTVLVLLARATVLEDLTACDKYPGYCWVSFPTALIDALSWVLPARPELLAALREVAEGSRSGPRSLAASLVHASGGSWVPLPKQAYYPGGRLRGMSWEGADLAGAFLPSADLVRARLRKADLTGARLSRARLIGARLDGAVLHGADLSGADLSLARLRDVHAHGALLSGCALEGVDLTGARLCRADLSASDLRGAHAPGADLTGARLVQSQVAGADFSGAILIRADLTEVDLGLATWDGACFRSATLRGAKLAGLNLSGAQFTAAVLVQADLTGMHAPGATFRRAVLQRASLGGVDWECADLRDADLRWATFHMGTSRSGLVYSPIASEGSRTGYYSDDALDLTFKCPEEIRKANLRGADLRGAKLRGLDLYLVDLRDARLDPEAVLQARRRGAILDPR